MELLFLLALLVQPVDDPPPGTLRLAPHRLPGGGGEVLKGTLEVFEDRAARRGRKLELAVVVLPATGPDPAPDPVFFLAGGPGQAATEHASVLAGSWIRERRDIVLVDQRGTGASNPLRCRLAGSAEDLQGYLEPIFQEPFFRTCLEELRGRADLTLYGTPTAMDDLDELRRALGCEAINLMGGSYGTRAALVYMRRHPESVRTATLMGVAPPSFKNPLYHAREAQAALEGVFAACEENPACRRAFPGLGSELAAVLERLEREPADVTLRRAGSGEPVKLALTREAFAEALRVQLYSSSTAAHVPLLVHRAFEGDYAPFVRSGLTQNRALRDQLAFGMLLSVTCAEDVARIRPDEIGPATAGTFLGDGRVRRQRAVCELWPRGRIPADYGAPVTCDAPTLLLSGLWDPVTSPRFAVAAARHLPHSLHVVVPRAHDLRGGPCLDAITRRFLETGSVEGLDTGCVEGMAGLRFALPE